MREDVMIRERSPEEIEACAALLASVHRAEPYPLHWPPDATRWLTPRNTLRAWVAVAQAEIVGHAMVRGEADAATAFVSRLFVSPTWRGFGLGARLLELASRWAAEHGCGLELEVDSGRLAAIGLYERMGWRKTGEHVATWTTPAGEPVTLLRYALT